MTRLSLVALFICLFLSVSSYARTQESENDWGQHLPLGVTHMLPSVSVLSAGSFNIGTSFAYGVMGVAEVGTNIILDMANVYNVYVKVPVLRTDDFGVAVHGGYYRQDAKIYDTDSSGNQIETTKTYSAFVPGVTVSYRFLPDLIGHTGFTTVVRNPELNKNTLRKKSGYLHGNEFFQEVAWAMTDSIAIAPGISYDTTYSFMGYGATLHIPVFSLGVHYYPSVDENSTLIILGVGLTF